MDSVEKGYNTQLMNIQEKTGQSLEQLFARIRVSSLGKHGEIREMLMRDLGLGHGDANTLTHVFLNPDRVGTSQEGEDLEAALREIYSGPKAELHTIHEALMDEITRFGPFAIAPKKGYVSLRRKKQFAMVGPASKARVEVGLNMKGLQEKPRLAALPPGGMCQYKVYLSNASEVDAELVAWLRQAYESAG